MKKYSSSQWVEFVRLAVRIARKDWAESRIVIGALTCGLLVPAVLIRFAPEQTEDFSKGLVAGLLAGAGFGYAQYCLLNERQRGTLEMLLHLPVEPHQLILAKYLAVYSMTLFTVNIPAMLVPDPALIFVVNATALFLATVFMASTVISERPWAPQVPIWTLLILVLPTHRLLERYFPDGLAIAEAITGHPVRLALLGLGTLPFIVAGSVYVFGLKSQR